MAVNISPCMEKPEPATDTHQPAPTPHDRPAAPDSETGLDCIVYGPDAPTNGFIALADEWNPLLARSRFDTLFLTYEWQSTWWQQLGEGELWILAFREAAEGRLVGIVPLYRLSHEEGEWAGKDSLHLVGCIEVSDFLDVLVAKGWEEEVYGALRDWLYGPDAPPWDILDLCNLPEASLTYRSLPKIFRASGGQVEVFQEDVAPHIPLPSRYEDYLLEQVDKKQRHEIRRKQRRAERETEVGFYFVEPGQNLEAEVEDFIALQQMSRPDKEAFMTAEMQRFFKALARRMLDAGYLRLCFLTLNNEKAATLFAFEYNRQFLLYNSGYDTENLAHYSPGWVLLAYLIQYAIATGCHIFDFLQGDEEYKYRFGSRDYKVMRVLVYNSSA